MRLNLDGTFLTWVKRSADQFHGLNFCVGNFCLVGIRAEPGTGPFNRTAAISVVLSITRPLKVTEPSGSPLR